jgi:ATP-dependent DNA helicase RecQ
MTEPHIVIVATIAFGMGIDKPDVRFVFHVDLPSGPEAYYQELGRCGRDGKPADAYMLFGYDDIRVRRRFIEEEGAGEERKRRENQRLNALLAYCEAPGCRRQVLLGYFGERSEPCGNCDICLDPVALKDGTEDAKLILSAVRDTGSRFGAMHIIDVLCGTSNDRIIERGHDKLACFGRGKARQRAAWHSLIRQLVATSFLNIDTNFGGIEMTQQGRALLIGGGHFHYRATHKETRAERKARDGSTPTLEGDDAALLTALKQLRMKLARERQVPPYVFFSDRSLIEMAQRRPRTPDDFSSITGVGAAKLQQFATTFLTAIASHASRPQYPP